MAEDNKPNRYVLCIDDGGYPESLEVRKVYAVLPDAKAAVNNYIRVIDESGEDYLYPEGYFVSIEVPEHAARLMADNASLARDAS